MVEALTPHFDFRILTLNRDADSSEPYSTVRTGAWNRVGSAQVFYLPAFTLLNIARCVAEVRPDALYLNGFFSESSVKALALRRIGVLPASLPVVIASRGDLAPGALGLKSAKKRAFMAFARAIGLYSDLVWHVSSEREKHELEAALSGLRTQRIHVAPNLGLQSGDARVSRSAKRPGTASFVTVSRITRMKNLPYTLRTLAALRGEVTFDIFGPVRDSELWAECEQLIRSMPANISVRYHGAIPPSDVVSKLATREFFVLPTLGENYGHVIIEAASAGCPVVISNRTQWLDLHSKGIGWDIPLEHPEAWRSTLQACVDMTAEEYNAMSRRAALFAHSVTSNTDTVQRNADLFRCCLSGDVNGCADFSTRTDLQ